MTEGFPGHVSVVREEPLVAAGAGWIKEVPMVVKLYGPTEITLGGQRPG